MGLISLASLGLTATLLAPIHDVALVMPTLSLASLQEDQADQAEPAAPTADPAVIELLDRLERADDDLVTLRSKVTYVVEELKLGDRTARLGEIIYDARPEDGRHVAIRFDKRVISVDGRNRLREEVRQYVFGGRWLAELDFERTLFIKREIARPGETFDPLKLGEGPFPFPIGQKREEVLKRFDVELADVPADPLLGRMTKNGESVDGLRLVPKVVSRSTREIDELYLFFDSESGLPRGVKIVRKNGSKEETALFEDLAKNEPLTADQEAYLSLDAPDGWTVDIRPLATGAPSS